MLVLTPIIENKTLTIVPRESIADTFFLRDDTTNTTQFFPIVSFTEMEYYFELIVDIDTALIEDHWYDLELLNGSNVVFKDKVFVTSQNVDTFSVNNYPNNTSKYIPNVSQNQYITYE